MLGNVMPGVFKTKTENHMIVGFGNNDKEGGQHAAVLKQHKDKNPSVPTYQDLASRFKISSAELKAGQGWILRHKHHIDGRDFISYVVSSESIWKNFQVTVDQTLQRFMSAYHQAVYEHQIRLTNFPRNVDSQYRLTNEIATQVIQHPEFRRIVPDVQIITPFDGGAQNLGMFRISTASGKKYVLKFEPCQIMDEYTSGQLKHGCYLFNEKSFALLREKNRPDLFVLPQAVFIDANNNVAALLMDAVPGKCLADTLNESPGYTEGKHALLAYIRLQVEVEKLGLYGGDRNLGSPIYDPQTGRIVYIDCGDWQIATQVVEGMLILKGLLGYRGALNWVKLREVTDESTLQALQNRDCQVFPQGSWGGFFDLFSREEHVEYGFLLLNRFYTLVKEGIDLLKQAYPSSSYSTYGACFGSPLSKELTGGTLPYLRDENLQKAIAFWSEARTKKTPDELFDFAKTSYPQLQTQSFTANPLLDTVCSHYFFQLWLALHDM